MKIIFFMTEMTPIKKILKYLDLWDETRDSQHRTKREASRDPPIPDDEIVYTPIDDGWHREMDDLVS